MAWLPYAFFGFFALIACIVAVIVAVGLRRAASGKDKGMAPRMSSHARDNIGSMTNHDRFN